MSERALLIKKIMEEQKLGLIEASQYIKANNLYTPKNKTKKGDIKEEAKEEPIKKEPKKRVKKTS